MSSKEKVIQEIQDLYWSFERALNCISVMLVTLKHPTNDRIITEPMSAKEEKNWRKILAEFQADYERICKENEVRTCSPPEEWHNLKLLNGKLSKPLPR